MLIEARNKTLIIAHRGASHIAPENTLPAFELAFKENADFIEGDFRLTKDGKVVCIHDALTKRTAPLQKKYRISSRKYNELLTLDFGLWKDEQYTGTKIPRIEEILEIIPKGKGIVIEIKVNNKDLFYSLKSILRNSGLPYHKIFIIAFDPKIISIVKREIPKVKTYWLYNWYYSKEDKKYSNTEAEILKILKILGCDGIDINPLPKLSVQFVESLRKNNLGLFAYTVESLKEALRLLAMGVDGITTNYPLRLRNELDAYFLDDPVSSKLNERVEIIYNEIKFHNMD